MLDEYFPEDADYPRSELLHLLDTPPKPLSADKMAETREEGDEEGDKTTTAKSAQEEAIIDEGDDAGELLHLSR